MDSMSKWTADVAPGEQGYTLYARLNDAFNADPILAMFVPDMRTAFINALVERLTAPPLNDQSSATVRPDIERLMVRDEALALINASPLSLLSGAAQDHLARTVARGLYPHASAALLDA